MVGAQEYVSYMQARATDRRYARAAQKGDDDYDGGGCADCDGVGDDDDNDNDMTECKKIKIG